MLSSKPSVRSVLLWVTALLAVTGVGDWILGRVLEETFFRTQFRYSRMYSGAWDAQALVMGNSRGVHSFNREAIQESSGRDVANLSFNALPAQMLPALVRDYLDRNSSPESLVIEVSMIATEPKAGSVERFTILTGRSQGVAEALRIANAKAFWGTRLSRLYRGNTELFWRSLAFTQKDDQDWGMSRTVTEAMREEIATMEPLELVRSQGNVQALIDTIEAAEAKGLRVQLVFAPYLPEYIERVPEVHDWVAWLQGQVHRPIKDYSALMTDSKYFADRVHLNRDGSAAFAEQLLQDGVF